MFRDFEIWLGAVGYWELRCRAPVLGLNDVPGILALGTDGPTMPHACMICAKGRIYQAPRSSGEKQCANSLNLKTKNLHHPAGGFDPPCSCK